MTDRPVSGSHQARMRSVATERRDRTADDHAPVVSARCFGLQRTADAQAPVGSLAVSNVFKLVSTPITRIDRPVDVATPATLFHYLNMYETLPEMKRARVS